MEKHSSDLASYLIRHSIDNPYAFLQQSQDVANHGAEASLRNRVQGGGTPHSKGVGHLSSAGKRYRTRERAHRVQNRAMSEQRLTFAFHVDKWRVSDGKHANDVGGGSRNATGCFRLAQIVQRPVLLVHREI
jgi:hypothetical protein